MFTWWITVCCTSKRTFDIPNDVEGKISVTPFIQVKVIFIKECFIGHIVINESKFLSIFALEPIANFCPFLAYCHSKRGSRDHNAKGKFVSLTKPIVLCTIGKL